jgi:hypothetical protein
MHRRVSVIPRLSSDFLRPTSGCSHRPTLAAGLEDHPAAAADEFGPDLIRFALAHGASLHATEYRGREPKDSESPAKKAKPTIRERSEKLVASAAARHAGIADVRRRSEQASSPRGPERRFINRITSSNPLYTWTKPRGKPVETTGRTIPPGERAVPLGRGLPARGSARYHQSGSVR